MTGRVAENLSKGVEELDRKDRSMHLNQKDSAKPFHTSRLLLELRLEELNLELASPYPSYDSPEAPDLCDDD